MKTVIPGIGSELPLTPDSVILSAYKDPHGTVVARIRRPEGSTVWRTLPSSVTDAYACVGMKVGDIKGFKL